MAALVDPSRYLAYLSVMWVLVITPGPANLFAIAVGAQRGRPAVLAAVAGMNTGSLVWFAAAALGLSALAKAFPLAFHAMTYAGAAYLGWLGVKSLLSARTRDAERADAPSPGGRSAFRGGLAVQVANPKALLFTTAILPPFLDPGRPLAGQLIVLCATVLILDLIVMTLYGFGGAVIARRMNEPRFRRGFSIFTGLLLITAAIRIAFEG